MNWRELPVIRVVRRAGHRYRRFLDRPAAERGAELSQHAHGVYRLIQDFRAEARIAHEAELDMQSYVLREISDLRRRLEALEDQSTPQTSGEEAAPRQKRTAVVSRLKR